MRLPLSLDFIPLGRQDPLNSLLVGGAGAAGNIGGDAGVERLIFTAALYYIEIPTHSKPLNALSGRLLHVSAL